MVLAGFMPLLGLHAASAMPGANASLLGSSAAPTLPLGPSASVVTHGAGAPAVNAPPTTALDLSGTAQQLGPAAFRTAFTLAAAAAVVQTFSENRQPNRGVE